jgi:hypothetical protein
VNVEQIKWYGTEQVTTRGYAGYDGFVERYETKNLRLVAIMPENVHRMWQQATSESKNAEEAMSDSDRLAYFAELVALLVPRGLQHYKEELAHQQTEWAAAHSEEKTWGTRAQVEATRKALDYAIVFWTPTELKLEKRAFRGTRSLVCWRWVWMHFRCRKFWKMPLVWVPRDTRLR